MTFSSPGKNPDSQRQEPKETNVQKRMENEAEKALHS